MAALIDNLIRALGKCPCCQSERTETNSRDDGIPDGFVHETVFSCGGAAFVTTEGTYRVSRACPGPLEDELDQLEDLVRDCFEEGQ